MALSSPYRDDCDLWCFFDLPFSAVLDTALLPVTVIIELSRLGFDWPPTDSRLDGRAYPSSVFRDMERQD